MFRNHISYVPASVPADTRQRLEALERVISEEVGQTMMFRARNLERALGCGQLYLKFEAGNPTGTHKDRIAFRHCMDAVARGNDTITVATCGNYGTAMAYAASRAGLQCVVYIPEDYHTQRIAEMEKFGASIVRTPGDYENAVISSRMAAGTNRWYDGNPGGPKSPLQIRAYAPIAQEIVHVLGDVPAYVAAPVSNGTLLAGIFAGFRGLRRLGQLRKMPRLIAGSAANKNPVIKSFLRGEKKYTDLEPGEIRETAVNEPLVNWHAFDGEAALRALYDARGIAVDVSDRQMIRLSALLRETEGINVLPAATAGLAALHRAGVLPPDGEEKAVVILTGKR